MSALEPLIYSKVVAATDPVGTLLLGYKVNSPYYLRCDGSVKDVVDYPELAQTLPPALSDYSLVDATNTRPAAPVLGSAPIPSFSNGTRAFFLSGTNLTLIDDGVVVATVALEYNGWTNMQAWGNTLLVRFPTGIARSDDNGLTWLYWIGGIPGQDLVDGVIRSADYNPSTGMIVVAAGPIIMLWPLLGVERAILNASSVSGLSTFGTSASTVAFEGVLWDASAGKWRVCGGCQKTAAAVNWTYFVAESADGLAWTLSYQEEAATSSNAHLLLSIAKRGSTYLMVAHDGFIVDTTDFLTFNVGYAGAAELRQLVPVGDDTFVLGSAGALNRVNSLRDKHVWSMVAADAGHALGIKADGSLWSWGYGPYGQLGNGVTSQSVALVDSSVWTYVQTGGHSSLGIKADGSLWVWGANAQGQLGLGHASNVSTPTRLTTDTFKHAAFSKSEYVATVNAYTHLLAVKTDGSLWAAGFNHTGQLGIGSLVQQTTLTRVGVETNWATVCGSNSPTSSTSSGSLSFGIRTDGSLWAWGKNGGTNGSIGLGTTSATVYNVPTRVGAATNWLKIAVAEGPSLYAHALGLRTDGTLWAWGYNASGQLGDGTTTAKTAPVQVGTATDWKDISASAISASGVSYALKSNGTLWGWGNNAVYQLLDGTSVNKPAPVQLGTRTDWKSLAGSVCISTYMSNLRLTDSGVLWVWGDNRNFQLGSGDTTNIPSVSPVGGVNLQYLLSALYASVRTTAEDLVISYYSADAATVGPVNHARINASGGVTYRSSMFGPNTGPEIIQKRANGSSFAYTQQFGLVQYWADLTATGQIPVQFGLMPGGYSPSVPAKSLGKDSDGSLLAVRGACIYRSVDGISWAQVGLNPTVGSGGSSNRTIGPLFFKGKYYLFGQHTVWVSRADNMYSWDLRYHASLSLSAPGFLNAFASKETLFATYESAYLSPVPSTTVLVLKVDDSVESRGAAAGIWDMASDGEVCMVASSGGYLLSSPDDVDFPRPPSPYWSIHGGGPANPTAVCYSQDRFVVSSATEIAYSLNRGVTWISSLVDNGSKGSPYLQAPMAGASGVFSVMASGTDALVSHDNAASFQRYTKPDSVTAGYFKKPAVFPDGTVYTFDESAGRTLRLMPGVPNEAQFILPKLQNIDGLYYSIRAK